MLEKRIEYAQENLTLILLESSLVLDIIWFLRCKEPRLLQFAGYRFIYMRCKAFWSR